MTNLGRPRAARPPQRGLSTIAIVSLVATAVIVVLGMVALMLWPGGTPTPSQPASPGPGDPATRPSTPTAPASPSANPHPPGSCVFLSGTPEDPRLQPADCAADGRDGIVYEVVAAHEGIGTCGESMTQYTEYLGDVTTVTLCLAEVLVEGGCYAYTDQLAAVRRVDCPDGDFRVAQLVEEAGAECGPGEDQFSYAEWNRTYCLDSAS